MSSINWIHFTGFDWAIIGIIALSVVISFFRGFLREAVSILAWVAAVILGLRFAHDVGELFSPFVHTEKLQYILGFVLIVVAILILALIINIFIKYFLDKTIFGAADRFLGLFFGAARGILAVAILIMLLNASPAANSAWFNQSQLSPHFKPLITWLDQFIPDQTKT